MTTDFLIGDRVRVRPDAGFARGRVGYVIRVELTGRIWVMLDGAMSRAYFHFGELEHAPLPPAKSRARRLIDFVLGRVHAG